MGGFASAAGARLPSYYFGRYPAWKNSSGTHEPQETHVIFFRDEEPAVPRLAVPDAAVHLIDQRRRRKVGRDIFGIAELKRSRASLAQLDRAAELGPVLLFVVVIESIRRSRDHVIFDRVIVCGVVFVEGALHQIVVVGGDHQHGLLRRYFRKQPMKLRWLQG